MFKLFKKLFGIKNIIWANYENQVMTIHYNDGSFEKYYGSCTVWHKIPSMDRPGTFTESKLCNIWTYIKVFGNDYIPN